MKVNRLLAGILSLVLISGFGAPVFAGVPIFVPTTGDMYGSSAHPNQGSSGSIFLISQLDGSQTFIGDPTTQGSISGLTFDSTGKLWGTNNKDLPGCQGAGCLGSSELIQINPNTGASINPVLITDGMVPPVPVLIQDLATQPGTDIIFGTTAGPFAGTIALVIIDRNSGIVSQKGLIIQGNQVLSIAFDPNTGTLYGADANSRLYTLDPNDASILNTVPTDGNVAGIALGLGVRGDGIIFASFGNTIFTISQAGDEVLVGTPFTNELITDLTFLPDQVVGGELLPIDTTTLMLAGFQSSAIWMIPTLAGLVGAGFYLIKFRTIKD